MPEETESLQ